MEIKFTAQKLSFVYYCYIFFIKPTVTHAWKESIVVFLFRIFQKVRIVILHNKIKTSHLVLQDNLQENLYIDCTVLLKYCYSVGDYRQPC